MPVPYRHTQFGWVTTASLVAVGGVAMSFVVSSPNWVGVTSAGLVVLGMLAFASLTVQVDGEAVRFHFGIGLIRKTLLLSDIEWVRVVRNWWLYGWGIRRTPHGWLYNVSGLDAVELKLRSGKTMRIGSDEPEKLAASINEALELRP